MRPHILNPLFAPVTAVPGIGPKLGKLLDGLLSTGEPGHEARVLDLLFHRPVGIVDRRHMPQIAEARAGTVATLRVTIGEHRPARPGNARAPYRIQAFDDTGSLLIVYFGAGRRQDLSALLPPGAERYVSGRIEMYGELPQMVHPDHVVPIPDFQDLPLVEPTYPLTAGLTARALGRGTRAAVQRVPSLPEWLEPAHAQQTGWPSFKDALQRLHSPASQEDLEPTAPARRRLAYDELLAGQLALALVRQLMRRPRGRSIAGDGRLRARVIAALPFQLTGSQTQAVDEILHDLAAPERMLRLLQGDVGSGKTVVALLACAAAVEAGGQAALMAPTEILARQHLNTIRPLAEAAGMSLALLIGRDKGRERERLRGDLVEGAADIAIGTHALFQEGVEFRDLQLAVVDEQHRFGVHQRLALSAKGGDGGGGVDLLVMTATPIPRTLVLSAFGDMDASQLTEKPAGRQPIDTRSVALDRLDEVAGAVGRAVEAGARVYWVCPLVEESEVVDLAAAEDRFRVLQARFGAAVGLVHGRMAGRDKDAAMAKFAAGETQILVATTVIEVGVNVPEATIMVIEHADRFGLAQLHQLRGRVGRGSARSTCLLLYRPPLGQAAKARLEILRETEDGFRIADEDLRLRGGGDLLGVRQSGLPATRFADLSVHADLLETARDDARLILKRDPRLTTERGQALRLLLSLFEKRQAVRLLGAG